MLIAQQKLKENIAEYILYMYQIEDVIRAYSFDVEEIIENYVKPQLPDASFLPSYRKWYTDLIHNRQVPSFWIIIKTVLICNASAFFIRSFC